MSDDPGRRASKTGAPIKLVEMRGNSRGTANANASAKQRHRLQLYSKRSR
jgi:hypothetical protein